MVRKNPISNTRDTLDQSPQTLIHIERSKIMFLMMSRCLILILASAAMPAVAQSDAEASARICAEAKAYIEKDRLLYESGDNWVIHCDAVGESATSDAVVARLRAALEAPDADALRRARLGVRLALVHVVREQVAEASSLALAAQKDYLSQPERDDSTSGRFSHVFGRLGSALSEQPELAAPHLEARVKFLEMLRDSESDGGFAQIMQPLALRAALRNALTLKDLDRAAMHASDMARLRATVSAGSSASSILAPSLIGKVAHELSRAGRTEQAKSIVGDDPAVRAVVAAFAATDAVDPRGPDLDLALRRILEAVDNSWWRSGREKPLDRDLEIVAGNLDGVVRRLRHEGREADAERLESLQHPQYSGTKTGIDRSAD